MYSIKVFREVWYPAIAVEGQPTLPMHRSRELVVSYNTPLPVMYQKLLRRAFDLHKNGLWKECTFILVRENGQTRRLQHVQMTQAFGYPRRRWVECRAFYKSYQNAHEWGSETPYHDWLRAGTILEQGKEYKQAIAPAPSGLR